MVRSLLDYGSSWFISWQPACFLTEGIYFLFWAMLWNWTVVIAEWYVLMTSPADPWLSISWSFCTPDLWFTAIHRNPGANTTDKTSKKYRINTHFSFGTKCYMYICFAVKMNWFSNMDAILVNCLPVPGKIFNVNVSKINAKAEVHRTLVYEQPNRWFVSVISLSFTWKLYNFQVTLCVASFVTLFYFQSLILFLSFYFVFFNFRKLIIPSE